jgi:acetyl-CoA carboxylase biotin carboxyl carrier protein
MKKKEPKGKSDVRAGAPKLASVGKLPGPVAKAAKPTKAARPPIDSALDLETVRELARIIGEFNLTEVEADPSGYVRVRRELSGGGSTGAGSSAPPPIALAPPPVEVPPEAGTFITSPFVGTFYRAPSPDAAAFAEVGQSVRKGQVVCIVEAMKLMNEIESEADGKIAEILANNGEHVEYGQKLIRLLKA